MVISALGPGSANFRMYQILFRHLGQKSCNFYPNRDYDVNNSGVLVVRHLQHLDVGRRLNSAFVGFIPIAVHSPKDIQAVQLNEK